LFVDKIIIDLNKRRNIKIFKFDFNMNTLNDLRNLPTEKELGKEIVVIIDRFELMLELSGELQEKILEIMTDLCKAEITIIVTSSNSLLKTVNKLRPELKNYFKVLDVPAMNFEETKKLVISRLNEVRAKKSDSLEPFTLDEVKKIHDNAKGNPRMVLLLLAGLFEQKF